MLRQLRHGCRVWAILLAGLLCADSVRAEKVPWRSSEYSQFASSSTQVTLLLQNFAQDQGIPLVLSEGVTGTVTGRFGPIHPEAFLNLISRQLGLVWFYDGSALYVYSSSELQSKVLAVPPAEIANLEQTLQEFGLSSKRYPIRTLPDRGLIYVTGPPRYMELVDQISTQISAMSTQQANIEIAVEVFTLKYAWADNQSFRIGPTEVVIPGVATILNNLINGQQAGALTGRFVAPVPNTLQGLGGTGLAAIQNSEVAQAMESARAAQIAAAQADARAQAVTDLSLASRQEQTDYADAIAQIPTIIQADPRLNAVIIRDVKERIPAYKDIIDQLDVPVGLVQIEAYILDIDANSGFDWGLPYLAQWRHNANNHEFQLQLSETATANMTISLARNDVVDFLAQLRALESDGSARMVSRPTVLTINNVEAILTSQEEFFVRVGGGDLVNQTVDLYNVNVGTSLRILPHIVEEEGIRRIKLSTTIEDGNRTQDDVDGVPIISRNSIDTQAILNEGNSLLIGGLFREEVIKNEQRVPFLGRIPKVGSLFTTIDYDNRKFERMVLITPTIIDLPSPIEGCPPGPMLPSFESGLPGSLGDAKDSLRPSLDENSQRVIPASAEAPARSGRRAGPGLFSVIRANMNRRSD